APLAAPPAPPVEAPCRTGAARRVEVLFSVADTGIGIPPEHQDVVFESFVQADSSITRQYGGTGLGLSICRALVEMLGGIIWLESAPGRGTTVYFTLPMQPAAEGARGAEPRKARTSDAPVAPVGPVDPVAPVTPVSPATSAAPVTPAALIAPVDPVGPGGVVASVAAGQGEVAATPDLPDAQSGDEEPGPLRPLSILLVEDSPSNRLLFSLYLRGRPCAITEVHNGEEGVAAFAGGRFDLVFMDIEMPVMDGYRATRAIRALEREQGLPPTPIIALTAHVVGEFRDDCAAAGCTGFLAKPFSRGELLRCMVRHCGGDEQAGPAWPCRNTLAGDGDLSGASDSAGGGEPQAGRFARSE
ncbi:response regulator, partial [Desulfovibrio oxamicus]